MTPRRRFAARVLAGALALAVATPSVALGAISTVVDYRDRVTRAAKLVASAEASAPDRATALALASSVRALLPAREQVREQTRTVDVSDATLASLLGDLESATSSGDRATAVRRIGRHLATLRRSTGAVGATVRSDPAALRRLLSEVRTGPVTAESTLVQDLIDRVLRAIEQWFALMGSTSEGATRLRAVWYAVLAVFAGLAFYVAWRGVRAWRRAVVRGERHGVVSPAPAVVEAAEGLPPDAGAFADALARQGRRREAVRALFGGAARSLGERGVLARTHTASRTNAELLAEVRVAAPGVEPPLRALSDAFELAWYGHAEPGEHGFIAARAFYDDALGERARVDRPGGEGG
ncbi:MAG: DUF4129 domain-containing protein [Coriobacteriia bacterium]|nr:DUF4129 domain-containing protein [Coriobacteriia bacterium]